MVRPRTSDLALAALVGLLFGLSPMTSAHRLAPSIAGGCLFGLAFLGYRASLPPAPRRPAPLLALDAPLAGILVLFAILVAPTAVALYPWYTESIWRNAHSLFVPLFAFGLARLALREHAEEPARPSAWGFALLVPGLLLLVANGATHTLPFGVAGAVIVVTSIALLLLGPVWTRHLLPAIAVLLFLMPLSASLASPLGLPTASAAGTEWSLRALDVPVLRAGVALFLPDNMYNVTVRCSGFSIVYGASALAVTLGIAGHSLSRTLLMFAAIWPLTWASNVIRSTALVAISEARGIDMLHTPLHGISGIAAYLGVVGCTALIGGRKARERLLS